MTVMTEKANEIIVDRTRQYKDENMGDMRNGEQ